MTASRRFRPSAVRKFRPFIIGSANATYPTVCCRSSSGPVRDESANCGRSLRGWNEPLNGAVTCASVGCLPSSVLLGGRRAAARVGCMERTLSRLLCEPLVQFLLIGAVLFAAYRYLQPAGSATPALQQTQAATPAAPAGPAPSRQIVLSLDQLTRLATVFE